MRLIRPLSLCIRPAMSSSFVASSLAALSVVIVVTDAIAAPPGTVALWDWPADGERSIVRPFLAPATDYGAGHRGIDISAGDEADGAIIDLLAPADGTVHFAGFVVNRPVLSIDHGGGVLSSYEPVKTELAKGDRVRRGEVIGEIQDGHCVDPCLHVGVRINRAYVSPLLFFGGLKRAVLLPTRTLDSMPARSTTRIALSGAWVGERVGLFESLGGDVSVDLGGSEAGVAEHLLHGPKVRSPVEQVGRGRVP